MTRQRQCVLDVLRATCQHPTADELYELVRMELPHISMGTVYRNLDVLTRSGEVRKVEMPHGPARYDADLRPHHHVRCVECGALDDVFEAPAPGPAPRESARGFKIYGMTVEYAGLCPACHTSK
jgi:Fur family ferric uptake transcriptional regulator